MYGFYASTVQEVSLHSLQLLLRLKIMESVENAKWKLQWNRINFLALLITVTVFAWVYHKGLPSSVKAIIRDRITHKLTATAGSHLNRRNLDKAVLCSVMLGVTSISWSGFGRPALLAHRLGSCASLVCECQEVFSHLPQGTCFIHFFWEKVCVCGYVHMHNFSSDSKASWRKSSHWSFGIPGNNI